MSFARAEELSKLLLNKTISGTHVDRPIAKIIDVKVNDDGVIIAEIQPLSESSDYSPDLQVETYSTAMTQVIAEVRQGMHADKSKRNNLLNNIDR